MICLHCGKQWYEGMDHFCRRDMRGTDGKYDPAGIWHEGGGAMTKPKQSFFDPAGIGGYPTDWNKIMRDMRRVRQFAESMGCKFEVSEGGGEALLKSEFKTDMSDEEHRRRFP